VKTVPQAEVMPLLKVLRSTLMCVGDGERIPADPLLGEKTLIEEYRVA